MLTWLSRQGEIDFSADSCVQRTSVLRPVPVGALSFTGPPLSLAPLSVLIHNSACHIHVLCVNDLILAHRARLAKFWG